jgi:phospholipid transport system substrate-binding protein
MALAEAGAPMEQMRQTLNALVAIFADTALNSPDQAPERRAKIQQVLSQRFAYEAMAQRSLGRHRNELTPAQQQAFIPLFSSLLEQMHTQRIEKYGGKKKSVVFKDESQHADGTAAVRIDIVDPRDPTINEEVTYQLQKHQEDWRVHDLLIDDDGIDVQVCFWNLCSRLEFQLSLIELQTAFLLIASKQAQHLVGMPRKIGQRLFD